MVREAAETNLYDLDLLLGQDSRPATKPPEVLIVRQAEAVIDGQHRMGPGSPFADEDHPEAAADRRARRERHGPEITQQGWPQGGLISLAERKRSARARRLANWPFQVRYASRRWRME